MNIEITLNAAAKWMNVCLVVSNVLLITFYNVANEGNQFFYRQHLYITIQ